MSALSRKRTLAELERLLTRLGRRARNAVWNRRRIRNRGADVDAARHQHPKHQRDNKTRHNVAFNSNTQPGQLNGLRTGMACIRSRGESTTATQTTVQS